MQIEAVSIIIPTYNGARRIAACLDALLTQTAGREVEILVINDGSTDDTSSVVRQFPGVRVLNQANSGPAAARNRGARNATAPIILFTDDDCIPAANWIEAMLASFQDPEVVGVKGIYHTRQTRFIARFVQIEYEDRYRLMANLADIDFIDTYSAGFRRDRFLQIGGYDDSFPVACAEDVELSYRMSAKGWKMRFVPAAVVYHTHPDALWAYLKKKYKYAFWRMLAVRKNPSKGIKDSHTPQVMKAQLLLTPSSIIAFGLDLLLRSAIPAVVVAVAFVVSTLPFTFRAFRKDPVVGIISPVLLAARSVAQFLGAIGGAFNAMRTPAAAVDRTAA